MCLSNYLIDICRANNSARCIEGYNAIFAMVSLFANSGESSKDVRYFFDVIFGTFSRFTCRRIHD